MVFKENAIRRLGVLSYFQLIVAHVGRLSFKESVEGINYSAQWLKGGGSKSPIPQPVDWSTQY